LKKSGGADGGESGRLPLQLPRAAPMGKTGVYGLRSKPSRRGQASSSTGNLGLEELMKRHLLVALILILCGACSLGDFKRPPETGGKAPALDAGQAKPGKGPAVFFEAYVPAGWTVERAATGDLNGDGRPDAAVSLLPQSLTGKGESKEGLPRALLILFADPSGGYHRQALTERLLPCTTCLGMMGSYGETASPIEISISDGRLQIGWLRGSRETVEVGLEFGYDPALGDLRLLRDDVCRVDRALGREMRTVRNFVTGKVKTNGRTLAMEPRVIPISEVDCSRY